MERSDKSANCLECKRLFEGYELATAARLQAEADFLVAVCAHDAAAIERAVARLDIVVKKWVEISRALRAHRHGGYITAAG